MNQGNPYANNQDPFGGPPPGADPWGGADQGLPAGGGQQRGPEPPGLDEVSTGGGNFAFSQHTPINTVIGGTIVEAKTELDRFQPYWDDGNPNWRILVDVQTDLRESEGDDGRRLISVKTFGDNFRSYQEAIKATGLKASQALVPGAQFWVKLTGHRRSSKGGNPELMFAYKVVPAGGAAPAPQNPPQQAPQPPQAPPPQQAAPPTPPQPPAPPAPQQAPPQQPGNDPWAGQQGLPEEPPF